MPVGEALEDLLANAPFGLYVDEPTRGCIYANETLLGIFGVDWNDFAGFGWARFVLPEDAERLQTAIAEYEEERSVISVRYRVRVESEVRWVHAHVEALLGDGGRHVGSLGVVRDVTQEENRRQNALEAQKLEAIGQLSARLAHDFNNLLTVMITGVDLITPEVGSDNGREQIAAISTAFAQARHLTGQLLTLSRARLTPLQATPLDRELGELWRLLTSTAGEAMTVDLHLGAAGSHVALGSTQLAQVAINLVSNARDAMQGQGRIAVRTYRPEPARARLEIEDTGTGMGPEQLERATEPFFTTKEVGRGSGLGLTTVRELVDMAGGHLEIDSAPGRGCTVRIDLPEVGSDVYVEKRREATTALAGSGVVLLVEDNDALRQSVGYALALAGYSVVAAANLAQGRAHLHRHRELAALVCDVLLPDGSGTELVAEARARQPELPIVTVSGFAGEDEGAATRQDRRSAFVAKPFRPREILEAILRLQ